jgi:hypothetical protein
LPTRLPAFNGFVSRLAQGSGDYRGTPYYLATAQTTGYATRPYTRTAALRLEWRIAEVRGGRLVKRWKLLRAATDVLGGTGQPSYQPTTVRQELKVQLATMQRLRRIAPVRLVSRLTVRSGRRIVYRANRIQPLRLGQPYRDPGLSSG